MPPGSACDAWDGGKHSSAGEERSRRKVKEPCFYMVVCMILSTDWFTELFMTKFLESFDLCSKLYHSSAGCCWSQPTQRPLSSTVSLGLEERDRSLGFASRGPRARDLEHPRWETGPGPEDSAWFVDLVTIV